MCLVARISAHASFVKVQGSNNVNGHGFGVNIYGKFPRRMGLPGDAGGDCTVFQTGTNTPNPPCGSTPELGKLDLTSWLSQAEGFGLPAAYPNMSVVATVFQVNADGGGPMSCEYNEDATATSWKPMVMTLNQAGNDGLQYINRVNETVVMGFPQGTRCTGGWTQTACIVRCRTGVNKRFGGCFAVKLSDSAQPIRQVSPSGSSGSADLSTSEINTIVSKVIAKMKKQKLLVSARSGSVYKRHKAKFHR
ncbi:hypothetical protein O181_063987 [Austropuccinia psidii MF-1]|uniref:Uncharacterized protein n=1 Tax=Austropuccinia psidii MF-1 TaxID=1389203 RepID=A0A9Q3EQM7_9BASI|nr:hypothetical protein [Austropuccinia psidii MF-1]